jgi:hypothetical protein
MERRMMKITMRLIRVIDKNLQAYDENTNDMEISIDKRGAIRNNRPRIRN